MSLPETVAVKLDAYTLFCRQLLTHLPALNDATRTDRRLTCDECCRRFDEELKRFFREGDPRDLQQAVERLGEALVSRAGYFQDQNPRAANVFRQVVEAARANVPTWSSQGDLEAFHQQGRQFALQFYAESLWPTTQARLGREVHLVLLGQEETDAPIQETFGYSSTPAAFWERYWHEEADQELNDVILIRFGFDRDFALYLAYPFLFLHEYVSHIFALDYGNERFNDGWLLYAADAFLAKEVWRLSHPLLSPEQIAAFGQHLCNQLRGVPRRAYYFAQHFDAWLNDPMRFRTFTWELAAFEPRAGESDFWPDQFINRLEQEFYNDRPRLGRKIEAAHDLRMLFTMLPPA